MLFNLIPCATIYTKSLIAKPGICISVGYSILIIFETVPLNYSKNVERMNNIGYYNVLTLSLITLSNEKIDITQALYSTDLGHIIDIIVQYQLTPPP